MLPESLTMPSKKKTPETNASKGDDQPITKQVRNKRATPTKKALPKKPMGVVREKEPPGSGHASFPIVGIGASAGGLEALEKFFSAIPEKSGMAFILVVHLAPDHISLLPELLQRKSCMPVCHIEEDMVVLPDHVYVIPPNKELYILNGRLQLMELVLPHGVNLPIDSFLRALAQDQGVNAIGIILSGTGSDGTTGIRAIKSELGMVMVQDEASAKYDGMPRSAIATNLVDYVLPPEKMPEQLIKYTKHAVQKERCGLMPEGGGKVPAALQKIFMILRAHTEHDFSCYKKNTICRRIERRMNLNQIEEIGEYVRYLQENDGEVHILNNELLIGVTNFFRDAEAFETLQNQLLPQMFAGKPNGYTFRIWVPACSSGEEAYSIAILMQECLEHQTLHFNVQVFGTDIDNKAIDVARSGVYPASIIADVSPERLKRFFTKNDDGQYQVKKVIREKLVFATQNVIKDPPFTKLDLLCCRNLLIYFDSGLQKRLLPIFHYSLRPNGLLFLGSAESVGSLVDLFDVLDKKWKLYRRKSLVDAAHPALGLPPPLMLHEPHEQAETTVFKGAEHLSALRLMEIILDESKAPPCVIIDSGCNIVYVYGSTGRYLEPPQGKVSVNLLEMARPGLRVELASAIRKVSFNKQEVRVKDITILDHGDQRHLNLVVKPVLEHSKLSGLLMVVFQELGGMVETMPKNESEPRPKKEHEVRTVEELERELDDTEDDLRATVEEMETSNEELKSANEELQSTNEELQSTNEELETSKEELQSLNEEAATVNAELQARIDELSKSKDDMRNLLDSADIITLFLDIELGIRRFTPKVTTIVPLTSADIGRSIRHFATTLIEVDIAYYAELVLDDLVVREVEAHSEDGDIYNIRIRPYRTVNNVIDGTVITFEDITTRKQHEEFVQNILDTVRDSLLVLDSGLRVVSANHSFYRTFKVTPQETEKHRIYELGDGQWDIPELRTLLEKILPEQKSIESFVVTHGFEGIGQRTMVLNARKIIRQRQNAEDEKLILLVIEDATNRGGN